MTLNRPWSNILSAYQLINIDICADLFVNPTRGSFFRADTIVCLTLNYDIDLEQPWSNMRIAHLLIILDICNSHQNG